MQKKKKKTSLPWPSCDRSWKWLGGVPYAILLHLGAGAVFIGDTQEAPGPFERNGSVPYGNPNWKSLSVGRFKCPIPLVQLVCPSPTFPPHPNTENTGSGHLRPGKRQRLGGREKENRSNTKAPRMTGNSQRQHVIHGNRLMNIRLFF